MSRNHGGGTAEAALFRGENHLAMRARNERLLLTLLRRQGALPKSEIARRTGLSAQAVSVIIRELESEGLLVRGEKQRGRVGQPSVPMGLAADGAYFLGLKVGRRRSEMALVDFHGKVLREDVTVHEYPTPEATLEFAREAVSRQRQSLSPLKRKRVAGLGIGLPFGLWNWAEAIGVPDDAMASWKGFDLASRLETDLGLPVVLENDASAACNAELIFGPALPENFLHVYIGFFVGGGLVLNGTLFCGSTGNAGALASMPVSDGRGGVCQLVEQASLRVLEKLHEGVEDVSAATIWQRRDNWELSPALLEQWLAGAARGIAQASVASVAVCDLEAVVIDGWLSDDLRAQLVDRVREETGRQQLSGLVCPEVIEGTAGASARAVGAASLVLSDRYMLDLHME